MGYQHSSWNQTYKASTAVLGSLQKVSRRKSRVSSNSYVSPSNSGASLIATSDDDNDTKDDKVVRVEDNSDGISDKEFEVPEIPFEELEDLLNEGCPTWSISDEAIVNKFLKRWKEIEKLIPKILKFLRDSTSTMKEHK